MKIIPHRLDPDADCPGTFGIFVVNRFKVVGVNFCSAEEEQKRCCYQEKVKGNVFCFNAFPGQGVPVEDNQSQNKAPGLERFDQQGRYYYEENSILQFVFESGSQAGFGYQINNKEYDQLRGDFGYDPFLSESKLLQPFNKEILEIGEQVQQQDNGYRDEAAQQ